MENHNIRFSDIGYFSLKTLFFKAIVGLENKEEGTEVSHVLPALA